LVNRVFASPSKPRQVVPEGLKDIPTMIQFFSSLVNRFKESIRIKSEKEQRKETDSPHWLAKGSKPCEHLGLASTASSGCAGIRTVIPPLQLVNGSLSDFEASSPKEVSSRDSVPDRWKQWDSWNTNLVIRDRIPTDTIEEDASRSPITVIAKTVAGKAFLLPDLHPSHIILSVKSKIHRGGLMGIYSLLLQGDTCRMRRRSINIRLVMGLFTCFGTKTIKFR
jgi:hypothetical protein